MSASLGLASALADATSGSDVVKGEGLVLAGEKENGKGALLGQWTVTRIAFNELPDDVEISLAFGELGFEAHVCNRIRGSYEVADRSLSFGMMSVDNRECDAHVMEAERNFLFSFERANAFDIDADGILHLMSADTELVTARRRE
ncbi:META domain-containing protein [Marimonas sp. MJW-29]|uniref:META domain-containing protein n=2 Tax=Sulfitobacter sediminis TaxID=3234186 RepID=A0ABV3RMM7_9RHOB